MRHLYKPLHISTSAARPVNCRFAARLLFILVGLTYFSAAAVAAAAAVGTPPLAVVTPADNDPQPTLHVSNANVPEGGTGATMNAVFRVTLSAASGSVVTVTYGTADGTAAAGSDYEATAGSLTFNPGETFKNVSVNVFGDTSVESDETFALNLFNPVGATTGAWGPAR